MQTVNATMSALVFASMHSSETATPPVQGIRTTLAGNRAESSSPCSGTRVIRLRYVRTEP